MRWTVSKIDEITEVVTKGTTPTTYGMPFTDAGVNFIKAEALNGDSSLDRAGFAFVSESTHDKLKRSILTEGDILVTIAGAQVGRCGIVRAEHLPANTNQAIGIIRVIRERANPRFVYFFFKNPQTFRMCQGIGGQAAQPNINLTVLKGIELPLPDLQIQDAIVGVLSAYDDLIENNRRRIALLEEAARLLYREWFVHLRFPGHEHVKIIDRLPEEWAMSTASAVMEIHSGGTPKTDNPSFWNGEIGFFTPKDVTDTPYALKTEKTITEEGLRACNSKLYPCETVFITARGTVGKLNLALVPMAMNQSCYALRSKTYLGQRHLYLALKSAIEQVRARATGAVFDAIIVATFSNIPFILPPRKLTDIYARQIEPVFDQIANLIHQNQKLSQARDLLLPRLMSGEIAV